MRCVYLLLFISGVVRARTQISVKKLLYVEAKVEVKDDVPGEEGFPSDTLEDLKKLLCLPGEECQDKKNDNGTTDRPYDYPSRRPCGTTTPGTTQNPCLLTTTPYYRPYTTPYPWYTTTYRPHDSSKTSRGYWSPTSPRPTRHPWYTTTYRPYDSSKTSREYWSPSSPRPTRESSVTISANTSTPVNETRTTVSIDEEETKIPFDCSELPPSSPSGQYNIAAGNGQVKVYCDMDTDGGNWTVIQSRIASSYISMNRTWAEYKDGFGKIKDNFWLGNKQISDMTTRRRYSLRIDITTVSGSNDFVKYELFQVESEKKNFTLHVEKYSGTGGDRMSYHDRSPFSTYDVNNDYELGSNCPQKYGGGWWYKNCYWVDLNAYRPYWWGQWLLTTEMKIRPADL